MGEGTETILQVRYMTKRYGGLVALDAVSLDVRRGEVHAVVGENGAGKSTLMKILGGIVQRDAGTFSYLGEQLNFTSPHESLARGISIIHQELSVLPTLSVIENVYMGRMPTRLGRVLWKEMERGTREMLAHVKLSVDVHSPMSHLSISQRQLVEVAKAVSFDARVIIMDEPNSSLSESDTSVLFDVIRELKSRGIAIIYVSHKIEEVLEISDRITTLRDGKYVATVNKSDATVDSIIQMMVGRVLQREYVPNRGIGEEVLSVEGLGSDKFSDVSFTLRKGEILCFSGLVGAGRSEVARAIYGADRFTTGTIRLEGETVTFSSPRDALMRGVAMLAEDRKVLSLFIGLPIRFNISIAQLPSLRKALRIDSRRVNSMTREYVKRLNIKLGSLDHPVSSLSGGNQQKTVIARWLATRPKVLILDEPTHGVDVGAKADIYELIRELAADGISIILISSELPEVLAMADRVVVMHEGRITGILERDKNELSEERIMAHATGLQQQQEEASR
jgi:ribose transport system ATP-binding protein